MGLLVEASCVFASTCSFPNCSEVRHLPLRRHDIARGQIFQDSCSTELHSRLASFGSKFTCSYTGRKLHSASKTLRTFLSDCSCDYGMSGTWPTRIYSLATVTVLCFHFFVAGAALACYQSAYQIHTSSKYVPSSCLHPFIHSLVHSSNHSSMSEDHTYTTSADHSRQTNGRTNASVKETRYRSKDR